METAVGIVETLNKSITDGMGNSLVAVTLLEVKTGAGKGVFHVVHNAGLREMYLR
jgi:hypothetical protein